MTNATKFKRVFGIYATELWSKPEKEFLEWLNSSVQPKPYQNLTKPNNELKGWIPCSGTEDIPDHEVLCCDRYGNEMFGYLAYSDDQWLCENEHEMMYDPIAWREKPEPYQPKEEAE